MSGELLARFRLVPRENDNRIIPITVKVERNEPNRSKTMTDQDRAEFEAWVFDQYGYRPDQSPEGFYREAAYGKWLCWQAARRNTVSREKVEALVKKLRSLELENGVCGWCREDVTANGHNKTCPVGAAAQLRDELKEGGE